ncbi:hypothetical protein SAMN04488522_10418 [Pedobacter caeni]|uniref:Calx-beta domain-containing protein n=2 Tax=Pedobacter caeni TaxID=288992 RepID=A0A1M5G1S3_9SPHI|nr:hypothetical protein SAMN04488522_10418 [Pedobacter caeni]
MHNRLTGWGVLLLSLFLSVLTSCSKKDNNSPVISVAFESFSHGIPPSGEVIMKIVASAPVPNETIIPFSLIGSAMVGTDYEIKATSFVFAAGTNVAEVKVITKPSFDKTKSLKVTLRDMPAGIKPGNLLFTEIGIALKDILIYSFESKSVTMTESADINLTLQTGAGTFVAEKELRIPVEFMEGTTAIEGRNFSFDGPKEFVIPAGKSKGTVKLKLIKQEAGKDVIMMKLTGLNQYYAAGNFDKTKITIFGGAYEKLKGSWKYKGFTNREWLAQSTEHLNDSPAALPGKNTDKDLLIFGDNGMKIEMTGDVKNYFKDATLLNMGEVTEVLQETAGFPLRVKMMLVKVSAMNVNFSATKSKIRPGELGLRIFKEGPKEILEVTIRDYEPTDFLANTYKEYQSYGDTPVMKTMPIRYHFERAN